MNGLNAQQYTVNQLTAAYAFFLALKKGSHFLVANHNTHHEAGCL